MGYYYIEEPSDYGQDPLEALYMAQQRQARMVAEQRRQQHLQMQHRAEMEHRYRAQAEYEHQRRFQHQHQQQQERMRQAVMRQQAAAMAAQREHQRRVQYQRAVEQNVMLRRQYQQQQAQQAARHHHAEQQGISYVPRFDHGGHHVGWAAKITPGKTSSMQARCGGRAKKCSPPKKEPKMDLTGLMAMAAQAAEEVGALFAGIGSSDDAAEESEVAEEGSAEWRKQQEAALKAFEANAPAHRRAQQAAAFKKFASKKSNNRVVAEEGSAQWRKQQEAALKAFEAEAPAQRRAQQAAAFKKLTKKPKTPVAAEEGSDDWRKQQQEALKAFEAKAPAHRQAAQVAAFKQFETANLERKQAEQAAKNDAGMGLGLGDDAETASQASHHSDASDQLQQLDHQLEQITSQEVSTTSLSEVEESLTQLLLAADTVAVTSEERAARKAFVKRVQKQLDAIDTVRASDSESDAEVEADVVVKAVESVADVAVVTEPVAESEEHDAIDEETALLVQAIDAEHDSAAQSAEDEEAPQLDLSGMLTPAGGDSDQESYDLLSDAEEATPLIPQE